jgi:hypothetical protein
VAVYKHLVQVFRKANFMSLNVREISTGFSVTRLEWGATSKAEKRTLIQDAVDRVVATFVYRFNPASDVNGVISFLRAVEPQLAGAAHDTNLAREGVGDEDE